MLSTLSSLRAQETSTPIFAGPVLQLSANFLTSEEVLPNLQIAAQNKSITFSSDLFEVADWKSYVAEGNHSNQSGLYLKLLVDNPANESTDYVFYLHDLQRVRVHYRPVDSLYFSQIDAGMLQCPEERQLYRGLLVPGYGYSTQVKLSLQPGVSELYLNVGFLVQKPFKPRFEIYPVKDWDFKVARSFESSIAIHLLFIGAMWIMAIYHLLIFFQRRDQTFLWYALYTLVLSSMVMIESGIMQIYVTPGYPTINVLYRRIMPHAFISYTIYWLFLRSFIDLKNKSPQLDRFILRFLIVFNLAILVFAGLYLNGLRGNYLDFSTVAYLIPLSGLAVGIIYFFLLLRLKDRLINFFLFGSFVLLIGVLTNTLISAAIFGGWMEDLPFPHFIISEVGAIIELVIFALALGYRFQLVDNERLRMEELNVLKSRFFANISHEFRTPLTVISGVAEQIKDPQEAKQSIQRNSRDLLSLVNQLLDLSAVDAGQLQANLVKTDIVPYLNYLTESFAFPAQEKNIRLTFFSETNEVVMDFDEEKIKRITSNLISNALKFTPNGGKVILLAQEIKQGKKPWLQLKVKDNGIGIPQAKLPFIFDRFYQVNDRTTRDQEGSGIGLALVKELVELSGGRIAVSSKPGQGSEFTVLLPVTRAAKAIQLQLSEVTVLPPIQSLRSSEIAPMDEQGDKEQVLIIEDNQDIVSYLTKLLSPNYQVVSARDGREGIALALERIPDVIISDVMMPEIDGYEVCQTLKNTAATSHIPIIILSAKAGMLDRLEGLARGADAYLVKPFNKTELFTRLQQLVQLRKTLRGRYANLELLAVATPPVIEPNSPAKEPTLTGEANFDLNDKFLLTIVNLIEKRLDDTELSINDLQQAARLSSMQVNRKLKALTGKTGNALIRYIRLQKAAKLLSEADLNVAEVAYQVGFNDPNYFSRSFSSEFGVAPSDFYK